MIAGALVMAVGTIPAFVRSLGVLILSRLIVGASEAMMMAKIAVPISQSAPTSTTNSRYTSAAFRVLM